MKAKMTRITVVTLGLLLALAFSLAIAQGQVPQESAAPQAQIGTAFTYQGRLTDAVGPVTGTCDLTFDLYNQAGSGSPPTGGTLLGTDVKAGVQVSDGLFTVLLDFGAGAFYGQAGWLQIKADCGSGAVTLSPRQELTPVPYALALPGLWTQQTGGTPNILGGNSANTVRSGVVGATIGGGGEWLYLDCWPEPFPWGHGTCPTNWVTDNYGTVSGGASNQAGNDNTTPDDAIYATVAGGRLNTAGAHYATVSGGRRNSASGWYSAIGGGVGNVASQYAATVPGGWENAATGERSFAAGRRAKALHRGAFVWADDTDADFASTAANQFLIRASGGVGIGTTNPAAELDVAGRARTSVLEITGGSDLAEPFEIAGADQVEPGMVVAIDPAHPGQLRIADQAYDRTVAGCVSGANGVNPGLTMQQEGTVADGAFPVALSGRVYCWADAAYGAIQPGDLLTTSDTPGHVMLVTDYAKAQGAIIGKAMTSLEDGLGLVLVLVSLQ